MGGIAASKARANFASLIREAADDGRRIVIEQRGRPRAAIVPITDLEYLDAREQRQVKASSGEDRRLSAIDHAEQDLPTPRATSESEALLRTILDSAPVSIFMRDIEGRFVFSNKRNAERYGVTNDAVAGRAVEEFFPPDFAEIVLANDREVLESRKIVTREVDVPLPDGALQPSLVHRAPVIDANDKVLGVLGMIIDISEQRHAEQIALERERQLKEAQRIGHIGHWYWTMADDRFEASEEFYRIYGFEADVELTSNSVIYAIYEDDRADAGKNRNAAFREKRDYEFAFRIRRPDGELRSIEGRTEPILGEDGEFIAFFGIVHDVTERKQVEESLRESEAQLREILQNSPMGVAVTSHSPKGARIAPKRLFMNQALARMFGFSSPEEAMNAGISASWVDREQLQKANAIIDIGGELIDFESLRRRKDGSEWWVSMNSRPILFDGRHCTMVWHFDITERKRAEAALRASEARFSGILDIASEAIISVDINQRIRLFNKGAAQIFGYDLDEILGKPLDTLLPKRFRESHGKNLSAFAESNEISRLMNRRGEVMGLRRNGSEFTAEASISKLQVDGEVIFTVMLRDVTLRKQAEAALLESEALSRSIIDSSPSPISIKDLNHKFIVVNKAFERVFKVSADEAVGRDSSGVVNEEHAKLVDEAERRVIETAETNSEERVLLLPNGTQIQSIITKFPIVNAEGELTRIGTITTDITEVKKAEAALRRSEALYRMQYNKAPVMMHTIDQEGRLLSVTDHWLQTLGYERHEVIGRKVTDFLIEKDRQRAFDQVLPQLFNTGSVFNVPYQFVTKNGEIVDVLLSAIMQNDVAENSERSLSVLNDVTEQKRTEDQLRQAQKMEAVGQLTGGIAHDFNNLLGVIIGNLDLVAEELQNYPELGALVERATKAALSGAELNRQLLAFSRKQSLSPKVLNLNDHVSGMLDMLRRSLGETIVIEMKQGSGPNMTEVDPAQLESALLNLAVNARDAMPGGGTLTIETSRLRIAEESALALAELTPGPYAVLTVKDTGRGMAPRVLEHAFEPFFTTKDVGEGSGLGLSMVFGFAKQSGGHVEIDSREGFGTTIKLYLPCTQRAIDAALQLSEDTPMARGETVLVVEDDADLRSLTVSLLTSLGYKALEAKDGGSALETLEDAGRVELLLTDVVMPGGMSGPALTEAVKRRYPNIKFLYMSGYAQDAMRDRNKRHADIPLLQKPFRKPALARILRTVLDA